jgi:hypothetical protein
MTTALAVLLPAAYVFVAAFTCGHDERGFRRGFVATMGAFAALCLGR